MKRSIIFGLSCILLLCLEMTGCATEKVEVTVLKKEAGQEVVIPVLLRIDPETGEGDYELVEGFNREYEGIYRVEVQWVTEKEQGYREELKLLSALDQLPTVITDVAFSAEFYHMMLEIDRFVNLYPYIQEKEEWSGFLKDMEEEELYLVPLEEGMYSSAGIFYNRRILEEAGIAAFPETWDDFFDCLEQIKNYGIVPLTSHESGEYWCSMLLSTAYMCSDKKGRSFIRETLPGSYHNDSIAKMLECMYRIHQYTFADANELNFNQAEERFFHGESAMMANGYWMIQEIPEEIEEEIGFASFPGNSMMVDVAMSGWAVVSGYEEDVVQGAIEFLSYRQKRSEVDVDRMSELEKEFLDVFQEKQYTFPNYQMHWSEVLLKDFFNDAFPLFLSGQMDEETFMTEMDLQVNGKELS